MSGRHGPTAVLALAAALALSGCDAPPGGDIVTARRSDLVVMVEAAGALKADRSASIVPPQIPDIWTFKILWMAPEGREVRKGDPVVRFDDSELRQELQKQEAERDRAAREREKQRLETESRVLDLQKQLSEAQAKLRRVRMKLEVPEDLVARLELAKDRLNLELSEAEVQSLKEQQRLERESARVQGVLLERRRDRSAERVRVLEQGIAAMQVTAPRDGTVVYALRWRDEKVKPGDTVYRLDEVLEIPDLSRMGAEAEIAEADAGRILPGQNVRLRMEADPDRVVQGRVEEISPGIRRQSWNSPMRIRTASVKLEGERPAWMRPGMRFRGEFEVERVRRALLIPLDAVVQTSGGPAVELAGAFGDREVSVKLGRRNQSEVEVLRGLREGQRIRRPSAEPPEAGTDGGAS